MKLLATVLTSCALVACGGGGGGSSPSTPVVATTVLTSTNQAIAAQTVVSAAFAPIAGAQSLTGAQVVDARVLLGIARDQLSNLPSYVADAKNGSVLTGAIVSKTIACTLGGSQTVSFNDADNNGALSAGDSITIVNNSCVESSGTITGSIGFTINSLSGSYVSAASTNYSLGVTMNFGNFTVTAPGLVATINGNLSVAATANGVNTLSETISTSSFTLSGTYGGVATSGTLTNYSVTATKTPTASSYQTSHVISGTVTSSGLASQALTISTSSPFIVQGTDTYASSGVMLITDLTNAHLKITALSNTQVKEELDSNGDGIYESSTTVNWNTLM